MTDIWKFLGRGALVLVVLVLSVGCGGSNSSVEGAKGAADKKLDDDPLALLPASALVVVSVDARAVYATGSVGAQLGKLTERLVPVGEEAGFVPSRDLDRVVVGVYSLQGADVAAVLVGKFDEQKIAQAAQTHVTTKGGGAIVASQYGGRTLYTLSNVGFTVLSARTAVAGTETGIRRALDRIKDGRVTRDQPPWVTATLETPGAAFAGAADFANQPIGAASVGMIPLPFMKGLKALRVVGNFKDPGLNIAGTLTYPDAPRAEAAAGELKRSSGMASLFVKNLDIKPVQTDTQVTLAVEDQQLRALLQLAQQYLAPH